jgi:hypothetical protein
MGGPEILPENDGEPASLTRPLRRFVTLVTSCALYFKPSSPLYCWAIP